MSNCKCKELVNIEIIFGVVVFSIIVWVIGDQLISLYGQTEWYRALGVTFGSLIVAASIGVVGSLSARWIIQNIVLVIFAITMVWAYSLTLTL